MLVANSVSAFEISQRSKTEGQYLTDAAVFLVWDYRLQRSLLQSVRSD